MGMNYDAVNDYGLILNKFDIEMIGEHMFSKSLYGCDFTEYCESVMDKYSICSYSNFTGTAIKIEVTDKVCCEDDISYQYESESVYFVPLKYYPKLFAGVYKDMDQIVNEYKEKFSGILPKDFPYRNRIRQITGVYLG